MDAERFWSLIERARADAGPAADQAVRDRQVDADPDPDDGAWTFDDLAVGIFGAGAAGDDPDEDDTDEDVDDDDTDEDEDYLTDPVAVALFDLLVKLPAAEIAGFDNQFTDHRARADRDDMANAATLIEHGLVGADGLEDFLAGLVALGRSAYESALADPDSLAGHPVVAQIAAAPEPRYLGREDLLYVAGNAYAAVTGEDVVSYYEFLDACRDPDAAPEPTEVDEWDVTDEAQTRQRLPRLAELFFDRSMRIRARVMAGARTRSASGTPERAWDDRSGRPHLRPAGGRAPAGRTPPP